MKVKDILLEKIDKHIFSAGVCKNVAQIITAGFVFWM